MGYPASEPTRASPRSIAPLRRILADSSHGSGRWTLPTSEIPGARPLPHTSSPNPQSGPVTAPDCPSVHPLSGISCKNGPISCKGFGNTQFPQDSGQTGQYAWLCKTLIELNYVAKLGVLHTGVGGNERNPCSGSPSTGPLPSQILDAHPRSAIVTLLLITSPIPAGESRSVPEELPCFSDPLPQQKWGVRQNSYNRAIYGPGFLIP
jgi:hypothetical protein